MIMPSIKAIGRAMECEARNDVARRASSYQSQFWLSRWQWFVACLLELIPAFRRASVKTNAAHLALVREYSPRILAEYAEYATQFRRWEAENYSSCFCGSSETAERERIAKLNTIRLTAELERKLVEQGWRYQRLATFNELVHAFDGYLRMDAVGLYWTAIEDFLVRRSAK